MVCLLWSLCKEGKSCGPGGLIYPVSRTGQTDCCTVYTHTHIGPGLSSGDLQPGDGCIGCCSLVGMVAVVVTVFMVLAFKNMRLA